MCYIYKDNQKSAYIQNIYWVYADYIRQLSYERTFSVPSYAGGVFLFRLADELVIYLLPISYKSGKNITGKIQFGQWTLRESKTFRNNICRLVYRLKE